MAQPGREEWSLVVSSHQAKAGEVHGEGSSKAGDLLLPSPSDPYAVTPQGRKTRSVLPLFSGYVFLFGGEDERSSALRGDRIVSVLEVGDQEALDHDLHQIHQMLRSGLTVVSEPTVPVGAKFRIANGPLTGIIGSVVRRGKRDQFVAVVQFLGRGATVDLEDWQVEPIS